MSVAVAFTLGAVAPLAWMFLGSFKSIGQLIATPPVWIPDFGNLGNYTAVLRADWPFLLNSVLATSGATVLSLVLATPAAFGLVYFRFPGRNAVADWILSTRMMPPIAAAVPLFVIFRSVGLLDTIPALIIAYASFNLPFAIWVTMSFFRKLPGEVVEAARLDGCSWVDVLLRIAIPMSLGGLATVATFVFIFSWNEFLLALFLTTQTSRTFPIVISSFISTGKVYWDLIAASSVIQCIPPVVFTLFMQKRLVSGLTMGAVKA